MQISALEVWHVNNEENNSQMCSLESGSVDENIETMKAYMCKQRGIRLIKLPMKGTELDYADSLKKAFQNVHIFISSDTEEDVEIIKNTFERYDDEMSSQFHKELAIMFDDPFERAEEERLELEREELRQCEIRKARIALSMLQPLQRERLMKNVCCGLSSRAIAKQEGVYYSSVDKSIAAAKKNFIKFYENL